MRIIAGKYKGRKVHFPAGMRARPTTDFAREGLFNILNNLFDFEGKRVLDAFCGSGIIGIECLSRGAAHVTAVDIDAANLRFIDDTCKSFGITNLVTYRMDAMRFLKKEGKWDFIFADPPYGHKDTAAIPDIIETSQCVTASGYLVLEHDGKHDFSSHHKHISTRVFGKVHFSIFQYL